MIVLDATNKTLVMSHASASTNPNVITVAVSYWSIDSSNVWTPHSIETVRAGTNGLTVDTVILPAPAADESNVVENIWIHITGVAAVTLMSVMLDVGGAKHVINWATGPPANTVFTLRRDGTMGRAAPGSGSPTGVTQNVN